MFWNCKPIFAQKELYYYYYLPSLLCLFCHNNVCSKKERMEKHTHNYLTMQNICQNIFANHALKRGKWPLANMAAYDNWFSVFRNSLFSLLPLRLYFHLFVRTSFLYFIQFFLPSFLPLFLFPFHTFPHPHALIYFLPFFFSSILPSTTMFFFTW